MHRLILMRHAQAESAAPSGGDAARRLSDAGGKEAGAMARTLAEQNLRPDLALVSSAARTRDTWERMHEAFGDVEVRHEADLYNAPAEVLRHFVEAAGDDAGCLLVLAHNPGVHLLAVRYMEEAAASPAALDRLSGGFPPGACAVFSVDGTGRPSLEAFLTPQGVGAEG